MTDQEGLAILHRLRRLHAQELGLYMARRLMGDDGEPQKKRLLWLASKILIYEHFEKKWRIMEKTKDDIKKMLKENYNMVCNGYLAELLRMWKLDAHYGYWIGDEVGGVYDYGDGMISIGMDDIIYCVEHDVESKEYMAWQEYICDAAEFGFDTPNLKSWHRGCPRTPQETFDTLRALKADLYKAVEHEKERIMKSNPA